ncbi:hypothetical protein JTE90_027672 [Oedothorax gibbosus]|uniref:TNFR-Cys domain-containing protein n=1 Tax=Oedothorax gibbosus TaxID=931172 RepID=A0AAV6UPI5_9ARAC|nr:hypothetical protein JTE90_027672 [Oedothorax gibbosus]
MKKGYLELDFLVLLAYFSLNYQPTMARHPTHHRRQHNSQECYRCPPGYGVELHCNRIHDTECGACPDDHYSSHFSAKKPCYPCSKCGAGLYVAHKCTASRDTVCDSCHTYRGPHNEDFYERCVRPKLEALRLHSDKEAGAKEGSDLHIEHRTVVQSSVVIASSLVLATVAVILLASCLIISIRKHCRRVDGHPYQAVATKEAVML